MTIKKRGRPRKSEVAAPVAAKKARLRGPTPSELSSAAKSTSLGAVVSSDALSDDLFAGSAQPVSIPISDSSSSSSLLASVSIADVAVSPLRKNNATAVKRPSSKRTKRSSLESQLSSESSDESESSEESSSEESETSSQYSLSCMKYRQEFIRNLSSSSESESEPESEVDSENEEFSYEQVSLSP
jgi:hypothetical protein